MDSKPINVSVNSEIGKLQHVLVHTPGEEIENMTPENAHNFLYSDILNLQIAGKEHNRFKKVLQKVTTVHEISDLLTDVLHNEKVKLNLIDRVCKMENVPYLVEYLKGLEPSELSRQLIQGVCLKDISYIDGERFSLQPLPNFFFMRDASFTVFDNLMISNMATTIRSRECLILDMIYSYHPMFEATVINPALKYKSSGIATIEGGDVHIVRNDIILCGLSARTNMHGIESLVEHLKTKPGTKHLIYQELPAKPESFIHLDMVFSMLDVDRCMAYKPVILSNKYKTFHITVEGNKAVGAEEKNLISALNGLGVELDPIFCGGGGDDYYPAREQWHSGTNFFSFAPGKVIGYARNTHTIDTLNQNGFEVLPADDVISGKVHPDSYERCVVTFEGNELSRGGGGARCMTMPVQRMEVDW